MKKINKYECEVMKKTNSISLVLCTVYQFFCGSCRECSVESNFRQAYTRGLAIELGTLNSCIRYIPGGNAMGGVSRYKKRTGPKV